MTFQIRRHRIASTWSQLLPVKEIKVMTTAHLLLMDDQTRQQAGKLSSQTIDKENIHVDD